MFSSKQFAMGSGICGLALAALLAGCGTDASGTVVDVQDSSVTIAEPDTFEHSTYRVAPDADISRDGSPASLLQLRPGDDVAVTLQPDDNGVDVASRVDATSSSTNGAPAADPATADDSGEYGDDFSPLPYGDPLVEPLIQESVPPDDPVPEEPVDESSYEGRVSAVLEDAIVLEHAVGTELHFAIDLATEITLDGETADIIEIQPGYSAVIMAQAESGQLYAVRVDATSYAYDADSQLPAEPGTDDGEDVTPEAPVDEQPEGEAPEQLDTEEPKLPVTPEALP